MNCQHKKWLCCIADIKHLLYIHHSIHTHFKLSLFFNVIYLCTVLNGFYRSLEASTGQYRAIIQGIQSIQEMKGVHLIILGIMVDLLQNFKMLLLWTSIDLRFEASNWHLLSGILPVSMHWTHQQLQCQGNSGEELWDQVDWPTAHPNGGGLQWPAAQGAGGGGGYCHCLSWWCRICLCPENYHNVQSIISCAYYTNLSRAGHLRVVVDKR